VTGRKRVEQLEGALWLAFQGQTGGEPSNAGAGVSPPVSDELRFAFTVQGTFVHLAAAPVEDRP
jgi:hypothetical protein